MIQQRPRMRHIRFTCLELAGSLRLGFLLFPVWFLVCPASSALTCSLCLFRDNCREERGTSPLTCLLQLHSAFTRICGSSCLSTSIPFLSQFFFCFWHVFWTRWCRSLWTILVKWIFVYQRMKSTSSGTHSAGAWEPVHKQCWRPCHCSLTLGGHEWWNPAFPGPLPAWLAAPEVSPSSGRCAPRVPCSAEGESGWLSTENTSRISFVTSLPPEIVMVGHVPSCLGKESVSSTGKCLVPCSS